MVLPTRDDVEEVAERLDAAGAAYERSDDALEVADPWGNGVRIVVG